MEQGDWEGADQEKQRLEEKQVRARASRAQCRLRLAWHADGAALHCAAQRAAKRARDACGEVYAPRWFELIKEPDTGHELYLYKGGYWEAKAAGKFENVPDIF